MWWVGTKHHPITYWLSQRCVARRAGDTSLDLVRTDTIEHGLDQLKAWLVEVPSRKGQLWLGSALCQLMTVPALKGAGTLVEAEAAAGLGLRANGSVLEGFDFKLHECSPDASLWRATLTDKRLTSAEAKSWQARLVSMKPWWSGFLGLGLANGRVPDTPRTVLTFDGEAMTELTWDKEGCVTGGRTQPMAGDGMERQLLRRQAAAGGAETLAVVRLNWDLQTEPNEPKALREGFPFAPWTEVLP